MNYGLIFALVGVAAGGIGAVSSILDKSTRNRRWNIFSFCLMFILGVVVTAVVLFVGK